MFTEGENHWIRAFETDDGKIVDYADVANRPKEYCLLDEHDNKLEIYQKDDSLFLKRDKTDFTNFQGNVKLHESWDPKRE
jgi:hypothetical protein